MSNELTDRSFWTNYWESKQGLVFPIRANYLFHEQLGTIVKEEKVKTAIELGGFPGYYTIFLKKYLGLQACLLDYFVHPSIIAELCQANGLAKSDIEVIETDLFAYQTEKQYDLVLSCGLIEHFKDTRDIMQRHVQFMKSGSTLFITLPNFRGLNGWFQRNFDRENYDKHEIACMDPKLLKKILEELDLEVTQAGYYGKFSIWLENYQTQSLAVKLFMKCTWFTGKVLSKILPFESKAFSPYILIAAKNVA
jgi:trans-aconitate methyltransferase